MVVRQTSRKQGQLCSPDKQLGKAVVSGIPSSPVRLFSLIAELQKYDLGLLTGISIPPLLLSHATSQLCVRNAKMLP